MRPNCHVDIEALAYEDERELRTHEHLTRVLGQKHSLWWVLLVTICIAGMWYFVPVTKPGLNLPMTLALTALMGGLAVYACVQYWRDGLRRAISQPNRVRVLPANIVRFRLDDGGGRFVTVDGQRVYQQFGGRTRSARPYVTLTFEAHEGQRTLTWTEFVDPWSWGRLWTTDSAVVPSRPEAFGPSSTELHLPIPVQALLWPSEDRGWFVGVHKDVLAHCAKLRAHDAPAA